MDQRLQHIAENYDALKIGVDEPFKFHCTQCGKCCIDRDDILLTPIDVYNIAKELSLTPVQLVQQYCDAYIGKVSRIPIVRLQPQGHVKRCPLLKDRKCSVHRVKPTVCAMFPIGRCITIDPDQYGNQEFDAAQIDYIFTNPGCGDDTESHTVREWLSAFGIPLEDEFFLKWHTAISKIGSLIQKLEKQLSSKLMGEIWNIVFTALYLDTDTTEEFLPRFEQNAEVMIRMLTDLSEKVQGGIENV